MCLRSTVASMSAYAVISVSPRLSLVCLIFIRFEYLYLRVTGVIYVYVSIVSLIFGISEVVIYHVGFPSLESSWLQSFWRVITVNLVDIYRLFLRSELFMLTCISSANRLYLVQTNKEHFVL